MSDEIRLEGLGVAPGVVDTIVSMAAQQVEGVADIGTGRKASKCIDVVVGEDGAATVSVHVRVLYGHNLREVASRVQTDVADAFGSQVGIPVAGVDVYVDGIVFE
jgi:uncharacterized alkaline shock family protein YloU